MYDHHTRFGKAPCSWLNLSGSARSRCVDAYNSQVQQAIKAAGGNLVIGEKIVAVLGDPPKRVCVTEFESLNKAEAWINSPERKALAPQRAVLRHGRAALDSF
jgi:uncharacterized protein (DUF1330 family)